MLPNLDFRSNGAAETYALLKNLTAVLLSFSRTNN